MAGGIMGVLSLVPWGTLIEKAPVIYEGASKLLLNVRPQPEKR